MADNSYRIEPHEGEGDRVVVFKGKNYQRGFENAADAQAWIDEQPADEPE